MIKHSYVLDCRTPFDRSIDFLDTLHKSNVRTFLISQFDAGSLKSAYFFLYTVMGKLLHNECVVNVILTNKHCTFKCMFFVLRLRKQSILRQSVLQVLARFS